MSNKKKNNYENKKGQIYRILKIVQELQEKDEDRINPHISQKEIIDGLGYKIVKDERKPGPFNVKGVSQDGVEGIKYRFPYKFIREMLYIRDKNYLICGMTAKIQNEKGQYVNNPELDFGFYEYDYYYYEGDLTTKTDGAGSYMLTSEGYNFIEECEKNIVLDFLRKNWSGIMAVIALIVSALPYLMDIAKLFT